jgi:signal-transduction protein with cAMP-binding, CBS, and nucleotidyltransferase domain
MIVEALLPLAGERLATIADSAPLIEAAAQLRTGVDLVVVCHSDHSLAGIVTKTDVVDQISHCEGASCTCAVSTVMTRDVLLCRSGDTLSTLWSQMRERGIKNVPLVDGDLRVVGIVTARDVLQNLLKDAESEESLLRDYVMGFGYR